MRGNLDCHTPIILSEKERKRFWDKVKVAAENDCWEWIGGRHERGYGMMTIRHKGVRSHRFSYLIHNGPLPANSCVCHRCDNPPCVNPEHLFLGTHKENMEDRDGKGRNVNKRGDDNGASVLTSDQVREIKRLRDTGEMTQRAVAKRYGVGQGTVSRIVLGQCWAHLFETSESVH